jgi:hypothetical protein
MKKLLLVIPFLFGCAHAKPCVETPPPALVQMKCNLVEMNDPTLTGLVCLNTSLAEFGGYMKSALGWQSKTWMSCGPKNKKVVTLTVDGDNASEKDTKTQNTQPVLNPR